MANENVAEMNRLEYFKARLEAQSPQSKFSNC
jgi:hypothetical protein